MPHRLLVLTDISSLTPRVREPDDGQSMVRLMLYTNEIEIEGLVASSNMGHGQVCRPELIEAVVTAYGQVRNQLLQHDNRYPPAGQVLSCIRAGNPVAGPHTDVSDSVGAGKDTPASDWIMECARRPDSRPLWVAVWGGTADLAQALWRMRESLPAEECRQAIARLRIHAVGDQDSTGPWIKEQFRELYYVTRGYGIRGMYRGGDTSLVSAEWVEQNIRSGHGPLGALYPNYDGGDIWSRTIGPVRGIKEGDTPSYLGLVNNGLNPMQMPGWGDWGGRHQQTGQDDLRFIDAIDASYPGTADDLKPEMSATYRWRPAFQNDFAARLDWCVRGYADANHAPLPALAANRPTQDEHGALAVAAPAGSWLELDASASTDPDGDSLTYRWWVYPEAGSCQEPIELQEAYTPHLRLAVPAVQQPETAHIVLSVTDTGTPPLTAYRRAILHIQP